MFDSLTKEKLRAAHDAARLLHDNHDALRLDPLWAIKLDTLRVDIVVELENRGQADLTPPDSRTGREPY